MTTDRSLDDARKRLSFRAWHRGTREADLIFGSFVDKHAACLSQAEIDWFEELFEAPEQDALNWVFGRETPPARFDTPLMGRLRKLDFVSEKP